MEHLRWLLLHYMKGAFEIPKYFSKYPLNARQSICSSHLTLCLTLNFIFGYCSRACPDLKIAAYIFCWYLLVTWPWRHGWKNLLTKPLKFGVNGKRIFCWAIFALEPITDTCPYLGYWPSKNAPRYHILKSEFVSLAKPIVLCTIRKSTLCWSLFAIAL